MIVVLAFYQGDRELAVKLLGWMAELGNYQNHDLLFVRDHRCEPIKSAAIFRSVEEIVIRHDKANKWPESANLMFEQAARYIEAGKKTPWLWMEPDAVVLTASALDDIEKEYAVALAAGKFFLGDRVEVNDVPVHMSGVGVYPGQLSWYAGKALITREIAWDVAGADQIVPKMYDTKLIEHSWEAPGKHRKFESIEQVRREIAPETVLFHSSKDGSLIDILRLQKIIPILVENATKVWDQRAAEDLAKEFRKSQPASAPTCDIFIKTYPPDYEWLYSCLRSINKFAVGFRKVIIVSPDDKIPGEIMGYDWKKYFEYGADGYLSQQVFKLYADTFTDADTICFIDSDTIFTQPVTPQTYFQDGKIIWMCTPYEKTQTPWKPIIEKFLKKPVELEFMRRAPQMIPRWLLAELRAFCGREHGIPLRDYVMNQPFRAFSEFNALGAFAHEFYRDQFTWINTAEVPEKDWPALTVDQRWSRGGLTPEIKSEWEKILSVSSVGSSQNDDCAKTSLSGMQAPGSITDEARDNTKPSLGAQNNSTADHIAALKREFTSPLAKARIVRAIKAGPILK